MKRDMRLKIDLIILDMECQEDKVCDSIEDMINHYAFQLMETNCTLSYKTFLHPSSYLESFSELRNSDRIVPGYSLLILRRTGY